MLWNISESIGIRKNLGEDDGLYRNKEDFERKQWNILKQERRWEVIDHERNVGKKGKERGPMRIITLPP